MEGEDLTQGNPSQPFLSGPGDAGKSADPANGGDLTPDRMKAWEASNNNKAQELAQERKRLDADRAELERHKATIYSPGGQPQGGYGHPNQNQGYDPNGQPYNSQPTPQTNPNTQQGFQELVKEFGYDGAVVLQRAYNQDAQAFKTQLQTAMTAANNAQYTAIVAQIDAKGTRMFGEEWDQRGEEAKQLIIDQAMLGRKLDIKEAMSMARAKSGYYDNYKQQAIDDAHKQVEQKTQSNVSGQGVTPHAIGAPVVKTPEDAFEAAWKEHGGS